jgi:hypothetical protein
MATATKKEYETHPEGLFEAMILRVVEDTSTYGPVYKIEMETEIGKVDMLCSTSYSPRSRFGELVSAVFDKPFDQCPQELDTDRLVGARLRIFVEHSVTDKGTWARVTKCRPLGDQFSDQ